MTALADLARLGTVHDELGVMIPVETIAIPVFLPVRREALNSREYADLRDSIKNNGQFYPIIVRHATNGYELIDGFLRLSTTYELKRKEIRAIVVSATDEEVVTYSILVNKDRIQDDPITTAKKLKLFLNSFGYTQEVLAKKLGVSQSSISNTIRLLNLPDEAQHHLALNNITLSHGLLLLSLENPKLQVQLAGEVVEHNLSTTELQYRVWDVKSMPHLQHLNNEELAHIEAKIAEAEKDLLARPTARCSEQNCLCSLYENEIKIVDGKAYCFKHFVQAKIDFDNEQKRLEREKEAKKRPAASVKCVHAHGSQFQEEVFTTLAGFEKNQELPVFTTTPNRYQRDLEILVYFEEPMQKDKKFDMEKKLDKKLRDQYKKHHPECNILVFKVPYTKRESKRIAAEIRKKCEELKLKKAKKLSTSKVFVRLS